MAILKRLGHDRTQARGQLRSWGGFGRCRGPAGWAGQCLLLVGLLLAASQALAVKLDVRVEGLQGEQQANVLALLAIYSERGDPGLERGPAPGPSPLGPRADPGGACALRTLSGGDRRRPDPAQGPEGHLAGELSGGPWSTHQDCGRELPGARGGGDKSGLPQTVSHEGRGRAAPQPLREG